MKKNDPLVIEKTANGWMVRGYGGCGEQHNVILITDIRVFNFLDYDQQGVTSDLTLYGFLREHFQRGGDEQ